MKVTKHYFAQLSHCELVFCVNENKIRASNKKTHQKPTMVKIRNRIAQATVKQ
jgi:hypothetical protein